MLNYLERIKNTQYVSSNNIEDTSLNIKTDLSLEESLNNEKIEDESDNLEYRYYKNIPYIYEKDLLNEPQKYVNITEKEFGGFIIANRKSKIVNNPITSYFDNDKTIPIYSHSPLYFRELGQIADQEKKYYVVKELNLSKFAFCIALIGVIIKIIIDFH